jgi:hypothetical protein
LGNVSHSSSSLIQQSVKIARELFKMLHVTAQFNYTLWHLLASCAKAKYCRWMCLIKQGLWSYSSILTNCYLHDMWDLFNRIPYERARRLFIITVELRCPRGDVVCCSKIFVQRHVTCS